MTISPVQVSPPGGGTELFNFVLDDVSRGISVVPEPSPLTMLGAGVLALAVVSMLGGRTTKSSHQDNPTP